ncbi:hypothetical protein Fleli_3909 [Bernardetia litoralis DSM 6794]|uniref:Uncharacterized protein n=1 Tax=Bernardetia litoralis (strain ATCC 23117 / DSM 6794 / NBRC 15988 / NCIMB 1366 / Fx l1 / Sio-4) TaxID=880071 RepID=I4AQH7_BERLS|nr:hypothetical protein Fleli_3909 [Bernardetia litoralis DSM 6794]
MILIGNNLITDKTGLKPCLIHNLELFSNKQNFYLVSVFVFEIVY